MSDYNPGDVIRLSASFAVDGEPTDPDIVRLRIKRHGDIGEVLYEFDILESDGPIQNPDPGEYYADIVATPDMARTPSLVHFRWESEGMAQAAEEGSFVVTTSFVGGDVS